MKSLFQKAFFIVLSLLTIACKDVKMQEEVKRLSTDNIRLVKEIASEKARFDSLKVENTALKQQIATLSNSRDTLAQQLNQKALLETLRKKADEKPLELTSISIQNQTDKGQILKAKSPFSKAEVRYLSFKGAATNNAAKVQKKLSGRLYSVYRLGTLVQQMRTTSGTFATQDGMNKIYTHSWEIQSDKEAIALDKGIGDKNRGIFQAGNWTLELWFQPQNKAKAYKLTEAQFDIK